MNRRLKILFLASWYPVKERPLCAPYVREHAKAVSQFHDVVVLAEPTLQPDLPALWKYELETDPDLTYGLPTYRLYWRKLGLPKLAHAPLTACYVAVLRHLRRHGFQPDLLHLHVYEMGYPATRLARWFNLPLIVSEHTTLFPEKRLPPADFRMAKHTFERAKIVLPDARSLGQAILNYGINTRCQFVPNVVQTDVFHPPTPPRPLGESKRLIFVGGFRPNHVKGIPQLFEALTTLAKRRTDWHLDLVGRGAAQAEYEARARELGLEKFTTFHGGQPMATVAELMRRADLFVLPSLWENFPCAVIEAIASGLPVVATATGDVPQMVDAETGLVVPPGDVPALLAALEQMLDNLPQYDRQKIARKADYCSPTAVGKLLDDIYQTVLTEAGR